jgi:hypothetical protein
VAAVFEHGTVKTEPPKSDLGLTTRFERNVIPLLEEFYGGAGRLDTIRECRAQEAKVNR